MHARHEPLKSFTGVGETRRNCQFYTQASDGPLLVLRDPEPHNALTLKALPVQRRGIAPAIKDPRLLPRMRYA